MSPVQYSHKAKWYAPKTEADWLKLRENHITATASSALFGVSPYMTPYDLYHRLVGDICIEIQENERMKWGKRLEQPIANGLCEDNGWEIVDDSPYLYAESLEHPNIGCSPDFIIRDKNNPKKGLGCLEIKNVDTFVGLDGWSKGEAPPHIEIQLQHQIGVCGFKWGAIGGLIGGNRPHIFVRNADEEVIKTIFTEAQAMLERVKTQTPPPPDYLADFSTIKSLHRQAEPTKSINLDLPEDDNLAKTLEQLIKNKHQADITAKLAQDDQKRCTAELLDTLKDTETVYGRGWKVKATTTHLEAKTITRAATSFRNCRVSKIKEKSRK